MTCAKGSAQANFPASLGESSLLPYPETLPGYYTKFSEPMDVYICRGSNGCSCPGGAPGICEGDRVDLLCSGCPGGKYMTQCGCNDCQGQDYIPLLAVILAVCCMLIFLYHMI